MTSDLPASTVRVPGGVPVARVGSSVTVGWQLAGFDVLAELGRGAQSTVFRVRRSLTSGPRRAGCGPGDYALKILDFSVADSAPALIAFRREAALLASVNHPGLARIHEVGEVEGRPYVVMDLVEGVSLADELSAGALSAQRVIGLALDIVNPLAAVHRKGLVHRDLKPPNIMMLPSGAARLIDFGLAVRGGSGDVVATAGTLAYAPAEQSGMLKRPVDNRSDLYSLGVVLFECLAGVLPFAASDVGELLRLHAITPAPDLCDVVPGTPRALADVVATLLAKDPDDRYQDGESLAADLRLLADDPHITLSAGSPARPVVLSQPLSGRAGELALLSERWGRARLGHGGVCVIRAPSGAGKSSLAAELGWRAEALGSVVLRGKSSADDPVPLASLRDAVENHLQVIARMPADECGRQQDRIRAACAGGSASMLSGLTPGLAAILLGPDRQLLSGVPEGPDQQDQFAIAVAGFLTGLAREYGELIVVIDDVQWLDPGSRRVLGHLRTVLSTAALLVVVTARDDAQSTIDTDALVESMGGALDVDVRLGPLDEVAVADQIAALMPGFTAEARLVRLLHVRGNGNPFVIQEYLRAIVEAGLLRPWWGTWIFDEEGLDTLELPQDAMGLVLTRVQGLGPRARDLLTTAAALGTRFHPETVASVAGSDLEGLLEVLIEAARRRLVERCAAGQFAFLHDRIREALMDELDPASTAQLHARIAMALDAGPVPAGARRTDHVYALAHHYLQSRPDPGDRRVTGPAFAACWAAGRLAMDNHAPGEALEFLQFAEQLGSSPPSGFLVLLGTAHKHAGRLMEAREVLERALRAEATLLRRAEIFTLLADVYRSNWNTDAALEAIDCGLGELGARLPRNRLVLMVSTLMMFAAAMLRQWTRIRFGSAVGHRRERCYAIAALHEVGAYASMLGMRPGLVMVHNLRILYWVNQIGPGRRYALAQATFGFVCGSAGLVGSARRAFARADADPAGEDPSVRAMAAHCRGAAAFVGGNDNGQQWVRELQTHGQWLDAATYLDAVAIFNLNACLQGQTREAQYWLAQGNNRIGDVRGDVTSFVSAVPMTHALLGRFSEAETGLRLMNELCQGHRAPGLTLVRLLTTLFVLVEQGELGVPFEDAVAQFEALELRPTRMMRTHRSIHYQIALGRLAQLRAADASQRPVRLRAARHAVGLTQKSSQPDELRSRAVLARADLLILQDQPVRALTLLSRLDHVHTPDAPALAYETARVRARALTALGSRDGERQARLASFIAQEEGWTHRVRMITAEFANIPAGPNTPSLATVHSTTNTGGLERQRLQALQQVSAAASRVLDPRELARITLDETIRIFAADRAFLFLTDGQGHEGELVPHLGRDARGNDISQLTGYSASLVERVRVNGEPLVMTGTDEGAALGAQSVVLHNLRSIMIAPLRLERRILGLVYLDSQVAKGIFTIDDVGILTALTHHIATSLETARAAQLEISVQTAQHQRDLADTLRQSLQTMAETLDPAEVTKRMLQAAAQVLRCDGVWLLSMDGDECTLITNDGDEMVRHAIVGEPAFLSLIGREQPTIGSPEVVPRALADRLATATSWIALPLRTHNQKVGALVLSSSAPEVNLSEQLEVAAVLAAQGMAAYDKAVLFTQVQELAVVDALTGIANRRQFFEVAARDLAAAARHDRQLTVLMVDIDHFKRVNDTHGHATGDEVICTVAARLGAQIRQSDILGRYGGEEFAVLLQDTGPGNDLPERLRACIADTPIDTISGPMQVTVSVGLAHLSKGDTDIKTFLARADQALYRAKKEGRNRIRAA